MEQELEQQQVQIRWVMHRLTVVRVEVVDTVGRKNPAVQKFISHILLSQMVLVVQEPLQAITQATTQVQFHHPEALLRHTILQITTISTITMDLT